MMQQILDHTLTRPDEKRFSLLPLTQTLNFFPEPAYIGFCILSSSFRVKSVGAVSPQSYKSKAMSCREVCVGGGSI